MELAQRCSGPEIDRHAWRQLYRFHHAAIIGWIRSRTFSLPTDDVEDLAQEVFLRCAEGALQHYTGEASLRSYLLGIAENLRKKRLEYATRQKRDVRKQVSLDRARGDARGDGAAAESWLAQMSPDQALPYRRGVWHARHLKTPEEHYGEQRQRAILEDEIGALDNALDRTIVASYYLDQYGDREISSRLRMPHATVTWRRHRALGALNRRFRRRGLSLEELL
jgi:RNA polymerase sigma factor (sigma-70 family)